MKKLILFIYLLFLFPASQQISYGYCTPAAGSGGNYISTITLGSLTNNTGDEYPGVNYADYSSQTASITTCGNHTISMVYFYIILAPNSTPSFQPMAATYFAAWIDYNNNNIFDATEKLGEIATPNSGTNYNLNFTIPQGTTNGIKRLRVMLGFGNPGLTPCTGYPGEVEDYSVNINLLTLAPVIGSNSPICTGNALHLTSSGGSFYSWSGPNNFSSTSQNPNISTATTSATGTYTVTITSANGCSTSTSTAVTVSNFPTAGHSSNSPICEGSDLQLTSSGGSTYLWSGPNSYSSTAQNPLISAATVNRTGNYTVRVTNSSGCSATATVSVVVNSAPSITSSTNSPVCAGNNVSLNASGGSTYAWTGPNSFNSTLQNTQITGATTSASGNYIVTVTSSSGCISTKTISVVVNNNPVASAGNNSTVCEGTTVHLHGTGGTGYSWTGPNAFTSTSQNPFINFISVVSNGLYIVTVTDANGCTASSSVNLTVNPLPAITSGSNSPVCEGSDIQFNSTGGTSYSWTGPHGFNSFVQNPIVNNATLSSSGIYVVSVSDGNCSAVDSINITVNPGPVVTALCNSPVCFGDDILFNSNGGQSFSWTGPHNFQSILQNPFVNGVSFADSGLYYLTVTGANNCTHDTALRVIINPLPVVTAVDNGPLCIGDSLFLHSTGGDSYSWNGPNGFTFLFQNPVLPNISLATGGAYNVTATLTTGCTATTSVFVTVNPNPNIVAGNNSPECSGNQINLTATGGDSYSWTGPGGYTSTLQNPHFISALADSGLYIVRGTIANTGCFTDDTTHVLLLINPTVNLGNDTAICPDTLILHAGNPGASFLWSNQTTHPDLNITASGNYSVRVTAANGCFSSDTIHVTVYNLPTVSVSLPIDTICLLSGLQILSGGIPANGIYSGPGITGNNFSPLTAGEGSQLVTYTFTDSITGCTNSAKDSIFVNACTGIEDLEKNNAYSVYPNPFNSILTIENYSEKGKVEIELMTVEGRSIRTWVFKNEQKYSLHLDDLSSGVYFLVLKSEKRSGFLRVVKE